MSRTFVLLASVLCAAVGAAACHGSGQGGDMGNDMPPMMYRAPTPAQGCDAQALRATACAPVER